VVPQTGIEFVNVYMYLSQFVKPPSDTLPSYFNMFNLVPSPSSLRFTEQFFCTPHLKLKNSIKNKVF
jgi:hypothetical protein